MLETRFLCSKWIGALVAMVLMAPLAFSQRAAVKIDVSKPDIDDIATAKFEVDTKNKSWKPKDWLEVEIELDIQAKPKPKDGYIDELTIKWYVAVENPIKKGKYYLLEKEVEYVNIPVGEKMYASVYLSPAAIRRLTGSDTANKSAVWGVGGVVDAPGMREPEMFSSKPLRKGKPWWTSGNLSRTDKFPLRDKSETPFKFLWWDRYLQKKEKD